MYKISSESAHRFSNFCPKMNGFVEIEKQFSKWPPWGIVDQNSYSKLRPHNQHRYQILSRSAQRFSIFCPETTGVISIEKRFEIWPPRGIVAKILTTNRDLIDNI